MTARNKGLTGARSPAEAKLSRRAFLKASGALGAFIALESFVPRVFAQKGTPSVADLVDSDPRVRMVRSTCLSCHSNCGIQAKVVDGRLLKIYGNPYHPNCMEDNERIPYETDPAKVVAVGRICPKGEAGINALYDPLRIKQPLKRVGPRGSGQWQAISWDQAITEIVEGGDLFGEGHVDGLRAIRDLETPIDPNVPEFGPRANQLVFMCGRNEHGQKEFTDRFFQYCYGTINYRNDHTSICETSHHVGYSLTFPAGDYSYGAGGKNHFKPDILNSKYIIFFGTSPLEAGFPMQALSRKLGLAREKGLKLVIVDPRFTNSAARADQWIPIKPGTDAAFALGMMRWMIDNKKYDAAYLSATNADGAKAAGDHTTWTDATVLVRLDTRGKLEAKDAGLTPPDDKQPYFVVMVGGRPELQVKAGQADLEYSGQVNGVQVKTVFTLLKERVMEKTVAGYAAICGVEPSVIEGAAADFAAAGKRSCADCYRGAVQHTNGTYTARAIAALNLLVGNLDWKGGTSFGGGHWHEMGGKEGNPYKDPNKMGTQVKAKGVPIDRHKVKYEDSTEFKKNGYPAKRPWFPLALNYNWQELIPSIAQGYPYPIKALINYYGSLPYTTPAARDVAVATLKDTKKVPLLVSIDVTMGELSALADYILPDTTYLERWSEEHVSPAILTATSGVRQPVVGTVDPKTGAYTPIFPQTKMMEDILIAIGLKLGLPGIGQDAFGPGDHLYHAWDWHRHLIANLAMEGEGVLPGKSETEQSAYLLARGGRFENPDKAYKGDHLAHAYKNEAWFYNHHLAQTKDSMTGQPYDGLPKYEPIKDIKGKEVRDEGYDFTLITHKPVFHTQSRTATYPWLMMLMPKNYVEINAADAAKLGLRTGDLVKVTSPTGSLTIKAKVSQHIRPGVVDIPNSYGHWEIFSKAHTVDGKATGSDPGRGAGASPNPIMRLDPVLGDVSLQDPIGGSCSYYDTRVKLERA